MRGTPLQRFLARSDMQSDGRGCWIWRGSQTSGYGTFEIANRCIRAHRWAYEHFRGPVPPGLELDHLCRVTLCVNPWHLEAVTHVENMRRGLSGWRERSRTHCPQGHAYDEANTYRWRTGRYCRTCHKRATRLCERRRRAARRTKSG
jgi:hypothetical protein